MMEFLRSILPLRHYSGGMERTSVADNLAYGLADAGGCEIALFPCSTNINQASSALAQAAPTTDGVNMITPCALALLLAPVAFSARLYAGCFFNIARAAGRHSHSLRIAHHLLWRVGDLFSLCAAACAYHHILRMRTRQRKQYL
jgi:hypothetical protein